MREPRPVRVICDPAAIVAGGAPAARRHRTAIVHSRSRCQSPRCTNSVRRGQNGTALPGIAETKALTSASNSKVKPPPSRAHGTLIFLTPHLSQRARGTRACSAAGDCPRWRQSQQVGVGACRVSPRFARPDRAWRRARRRQGAVCAALRLAWGPSLTATARECLAVIRPGQKDAAQPNRRT